MFRLKWASFAKMNEFHDRLQELTPKYSEGNSLLAVRAFAMGAERTVRDNTVGFGSFGG